MTLSASIIVIYACLEYLFSLTFVAYTLLDKHSTQLILISLTFLKDMPIMRFTFCHKNQKDSDLTQQFESQKINKFV